MEGETNLSFINALVEARNPRTGKSEEWRKTSTKDKDTDKNNIKTKKRKRR